MTESQPIGGSLTRHSFRFGILVLTTACLTIVFSNVVTLNFTLTCMGLNQTNSNAPVHAFTQTDKTYFQWAVSIASMIGTFPFSWACKNYGAKYVFLVSGLISAVSTALIPLAASVGFVWFVIVRLLQGLSYSCDFAVIGVICTRWASLSEVAKFIALMTCFSPIANSFTNIVAGVICDSSLGWPWVHYFHAIVSLLLFILWGYFYNDDPATSPFVSTRELAIIHRDKSEAHKNHSSFVPYRAICTNKVVWAVWIAAFADLFSGFFLFIYAPSYTRNVLGYSSTETGVVGAIGSLSHIPVKLLCGYISDTYHCMPERKKMWIFNSVALLTPAAIYLYGVYLCLPAAAGNPMVVVILFGAVHAGLGANCGGFYKCGALVSRQYAEFTIANTQFIKCSVFFVAPALMAIFVQDDSVAAQWHAIFYCTAGSLILANALFCVYATDKPQPFTFITEKKKEDEQE